MKTTGKNFRVPGLREGAKNRQREYLDLANEELEEEKPTYESICKEAGICPGCWEPVAHDGSCMCTLESNTKVVPDDTCRVCGYCMDDCNCSYYDDGEDY